MPLYLSKPLRDEMEKQSQSDDTTSNTSASTVTDWILATAHSSGAIQVWETRNGGLRLLATLSVPSPSDGACRCEILFCSAAQMDQVAAAAAAAAAFSTPRARARSGRRAMGVCVCLPR